MNKHFYATAQLVAHRRKTITYQPDTLEETQKEIQTWLKDPFIVRNIRQLTLTGDVRQPLQSDGKPDPLDLTLMWAPLVELIAQAARLVKLDFNCRSAPFPLELLEALQTYHPQVKLYLWDYYRDEELDHTDAAERALAVSPVLRGIRANGWTKGGGAPIDLRIAAFQRIVANAPNLEFASITQGQSGCIVHYQEPEDQVREHEAAAKFFLASRGPNTSVRKLILDGFSLNKATLIEWGKHVSLPHLDDLKCSRGLPESTYFELAPSILTNLKHVSLNLSNASRHLETPALVEQYLATCAPLETLSLWSWTGVVSLDTILKHGQHLKTLELHEREALNLGTRRSLLSIEELRRIRNECPRLEDLTLDMDRENADWHHDLDHHEEMLQEIARFGKRLRRMQIYLDLGVANRIAGWHGPATSSQVPNTHLPGKVDEGQHGGGTAGDTVTPSAEHLYRGPFNPPSRPEMRKHGVQLWKVIFGDPMRTGPRELDIKWGEWERKIGAGYPAHWVRWEYKNRRYVRVRPEERDDKPGEAIAHVVGGHGEADPDSD